MAKRIVILGAGESGAGAAVLAKKQGFDTFVSDMSTIKDTYKNMLNERGIEWEEGKHTESLILNADEVIKSPGIPNDAPMILKLKSQGTPIISEIEFAGRYTNAKMICITGSNGKTTTTSLIYHIFKKAGMNVGLAGNIGQSLAYQVAECNYDYYVIELSSFQLDNMYKFQPSTSLIIARSVCQIYSGNFSRNKFFIFLLHNCNKRPYNRIHLQALLVNFLLNVLSIINTNFFIILFLINSKNNNATIILIRKA